MGTILEVGIKPAYRRLGLGGKIVQYVEEQLKSSGMSQCYVSSYGPAQEFWKNCGYQFNGANASNGLPLMVKHL